MLLLLGVAGLEGSAELVGSTVVPAILVCYMASAVSVALIPLSLASIDRGQLYDLVLYMLGIGWLLSHLVRRIQTYGELYASVGELSGEAMVLCVYVLAPGAVLLTPVLEAVRWWRR